MKNLIFVDNDNETLAKKDSDNVKTNLETFFNLPEDIIETMSIVSDFRNLSKDEMYEMLFDKNNVICTWSMYTTSHCNSLGQLISLLSGAGRNNIQNIIYIDGSGELLDRLNSIIRDNPTHAYYIIQAIETNYIISLSFNENKGGRIRMNFKGIMERCFELEPIDLFELFINEEKPQVGDLVFTHNLDDVSVGDIIYDRNGKRYEVDETTGEDKKIISSNGKLIAQTHTSGHNMFTKKPFIAKRLK
jgi:hypothetical protein